MLGSPLHLSADSEVLVHDLRPSEIDQVVAIVGNDMITQSDIENQIMQYSQMGMMINENTTCEILEEFLIQKLLVNQARIDSLNLSPSRVESEMDRRLKYFISQIGSKKKLEEYYNKSIIEIKEDLRPIIEEQLLAQMMQEKILENIKVTPSEVTDYYEKTPKDSLPYIESEIELREIVLYPPLTEEAIYEVKQKLLELRKRILAGENFEVFARLYSEDYTSAQKGGNLGFIGRDEMVPAFSDVAFSLKKGGLSNIVETEYGYHLIQVIDKEEDRVNVRHILMRPKISNDHRNIISRRLDSIVSLIKIDTLTFEKAAMKFSQNNKSKPNGGLMVNEKTGSTKFKYTDLPKADYYAIMDLKVGDISKVFESVDEKGKTIFKVVKVCSKTNPHVANLKDDYSIIQDLTKNKKQEKLISEWIQNKLEKTFVHIDPMYSGCNFRNKGWIK